jgi:hypothetical protein
MTDSSEKIPSEFATLSCNEIVYRTIMKKKWLNEDTGQILKEAFFCKKLEMRQAYL